jgi:Na+-driven multidrug efflux pump
LTEYGPSVLVLQILSAGLLFLYIDMVLGTTLMSSDRQSQMSVVSMIMICVNIALNFLLIPLFQTRYGNGGVGSAVAIAITELCVMIASLRLMPEGILKGFRTGVVVKSLLSGIAMAGTIVLIRLVDSLWILAACAGPVVYAAALFLMRTFEPGEETFLRGMLALRTIRNFRNLLGDDEGGRL